MIVFDGAYLLSVRGITKMQAFPSKKKKKRCKLRPFERKKKYMLRAIFAKMFRTIEHFSFAIHIQDKNIGQGSVF